MDLADILDVTEPVPVAYMEQMIVAHVYTAGATRLTHEEADVLRKLNDLRTADGLSDGEKAEQERKAYHDSVISIRSVLRLMVKAIELNGEPLVFRGASFPDNIELFPDSLLSAIGNPVLDKWNGENPTSGEVAQSGSLTASENSEQSQTETTSP